MMYSFSVYLVLFCFCVVDIANGNALDAIINAVLKITGSTILEYDQTKHSRRFVVEPATKPVWSAWSDARPCSVSCGAGFTEKTRTCSTGNRKDCTGPTWQVIPCTERSCAAWAAWATGASTCSTSCGDGVTEYRRNCSTGNVYECERKGGTYWKIDKCNIQPCGAHWSAWQVTKACTVTCGSGIQVRQRTCSTGNKIDCAQLAGKYYELATCTPGPCQSTTTALHTVTALVPAVWSAWSDAKPCSVSCGTGFMEKTRTCSTGSIKDCRGQPWEVMSCTERSCAVDDQWGPWSTFSPCSASCGAGYHFRSRVCLSAKCVGDNFDTNTCITGQCQVDGKLSQWTVWSQCSHTCNGGLQTRSRVCTYDPVAPRGSDCVGNMRENRNCGTQTCPDTTTVMTTTTTTNAWSKWFYGACSVTCGTGTRQGIRRCSSGKDQDCVGSSSINDTCQAKPCGVWSKWFYEPCSTTCGPGTKQGIRRCSSGDEHECSGLASQTIQCEDRPCPVDGGWGSWQPWESCSESCGNGTTRRHRVCNNPVPQHNGQMCHGGPNEYDTKNCKLVDCPHWGSYHQVGTCSVTCGDGVIQLQRNCSTGNNHDCTGSAYDEKPCSKPAC